MIRLCLVVLLLPLPLLAETRTPAPLPAEKAAKDDGPARRLPRHPVRGRAGRGAADLVHHRRTAAGCGSPRRSTTATGSRPARTASSSSKTPTATAGLTAHGLLRGLQLHHRHRGRLRRRLGHVAAEPVLRPRPRRRRQAGRPARGRLRRVRLQGEPAQPRQRLHLGAGWLALRRARPHQPVGRRPARHARRQAHPLRRRRLPHPPDASASSRTSPTARPTRGAWTSTTTAQCFVSNCVNPHLFHMIQGGHYEPWRNRPSSLYAYERLPTIADHLHYAGGDLKRRRSARPTRWRWAAATPTAARSSTSATASPPTTATPSSCATSTAAASTTTS